MDPQAFTPLSMLMENSILIPLRAQLGVVNSAVLNYMLVDARLNDHFKVERQTSFDRTFRLFLALTPKAQLHHRS